MIVISFATATVAALELLADAANGLDGYVEPLVTLVTTGGFGAMLWYYVVKRQPQVEEEHRKERAEWEARHRQEREDSRQKFMESIREDRAEFIKLSERGTSALTALREELKRRTDGH